MPRRHTSQRESDLATLPRRYILGEPLAEIAESYGVQKDQILEDMIEVRRRWLATSVRGFDEMVAEQLARIDILETEYWKGWQRSQEDEETKVAERKVRASADGKSKLPVEEKARTQSRGREGNPRFLEGVERCVDKRCKLFALYAPARVDITWREELSGQGIDPDAVFEQVVEKYLEEMEVSIQDPALPKGVTSQIEEGKREYVVDDDI